MSRSQHYCGLKDKNHAYLSKSFVEMSSEINEEKYNLVSA